MHVKGMWKVIWTLVCDYTMCFLQKTSHRVGKGTRSPLRAIVILVIFHESARRGEASEFQAGKEAEDCIYVENCVDQTLPELLHVGGS